MKKLLAIAIAASTPMMAQADLLFTIDAGANFWNVEANGDVDDAELGSDGLDLDSETTNVLFVSFEHPVPVLPNIKIQQTDLDLSGDGTATYDFMGVTYNGDTSSQFDLSHTDLTLYWGVPLPIPFFDINFGLTARQFDGIVSVTDKTTSNTEEQDLDFVLPMGYLNVDFDSHIGIYGRAELNAIAYDGNSMTDTTFAVGYTLPLPIPMVDVNIEAGHRMISLKTDEDSTDIDIDADVSGMFAGLNISIGL